MVRSIRESYKRDIIAQNFVVVNEETKA